MTALDVLGGLAAAERSAGVGDVAQRVYVATFWAYAWEAEIARLGLPYTGTGWAATPLATPEQIQQALAATEEP